RANGRRTFHVVNIVADHLLRLRVPNHDGFFGVGRSAAVFFSIDRDVTHFTFLQRSLVRDVSRARALLSDAALTFGRFVFRDDVGERADDRARAAAGADRPARAGAGGRG